MVPQIPNPTMSLLKRYPIYGIAKIVTHLSEFGDKHP